MARPQVIDDANREIQRQNDLRQAYSEWEDTFVARDLIAHLTERRDSSQEIAGSEMENMDKKALYLQDAYVYGKVLAYISEMID